MKPSVGRIVLYTNLGDADGKYPPEQQAAIITKVVPVPDAAFGEGDERGFAVSLTIFEPPSGVAGAKFEAGVVRVADVPYSAAPKAGHWSWPPRV